MTIKKIALSVVATTALSVSAIAGVVSNVGTPGLIGQEKLSLSDVNITNGFGNVLSIKYTPTAIPATRLKNPVFVFTYSSVKDITNADSNLSVFVLNDDGNESDPDLNNWTQIASDPQVSSSATTGGGNNNVISFNAVNSDIYAYNNKKYVIASNSDGRLTTADVNLTIAEDSTADVQVEVALWSGDSQDIQDHASATTIAKVGPEYQAHFTRKFDAKINAADAFHSFYDNTTTTSEDGHSDSMIVALTQNPTIHGSSLNVADAKMVVFYDQNLTQLLTNSVIAVASSNGSRNALYDFNDYNATASMTSIFNTDNSGADVNATTILTVNGEDKIEKTIFDAYVYIQSGDTTFTLVPKVTKNAGEWAIYGYNAQIPNVAGVEGRYETTMKFTNRSGLDTDIFFTLIDQDGTIVELSSADFPNEIAALPHNTTGKYNATDLLALVTDPEFDKNRSISVEVSIPTTPSAVYGAAAFKNNMTGQFNDLPIYNTSSMTY